MLMEFDKCQNPIDFKEFFHNFKEPSHAHKLKSTLWLVKTKEELLLLTTNKTLTLAQFQKKKGSKELKRNQ